MERPPNPRSAFRARTFRVPAGLGCLVALVTVPIALVAGVLTGVAALLLPGSRRRRSAFPEKDSPRSFGPSRAALGATGFALCSLVEKMSLDADFALADAQTAGVPVGTDVTVEALLREALARGWVEQRGERFAVTPSGRDETAAILRRMST